MPPLVNVIKIVVCKNIIAQSIVYIYINFMHFLAPVHQI